MDEISEPMIQNNLRLRFQKHQIYTNIGTILISVNPFKRLPLYTPSVIDDYIHKGKRDMPPHVFNIAEAAFRHLMDDKSDQSILISGESGAGKTEATKQCLMFFAECAGSVTGVEQNILLSNPILEAFGNAKTLRNNNSSRFGKLISVLFDGRAKITGAGIINYLLEKSRVVYQLEGERSFHIFYQLIIGANADIKQRFAIWNAADYYYISQSGCSMIDGVDDQKEWDEMIEAMVKMGFSEDDQENIFRLVSSVLHLGNIDFQPSQKANLRTDTCEVTNPQCLDICSDLLQVAAGDLLTACTNRTMVVRGEAPTKIPLGHEAASDNRNSFAKKIYSHLFDWIVVKVNQGMAPPKGAVRTGQINVLDIFGFEIFEVNSFEQLCINFCNEKLQQHFNQHTFKLEEQLYRREQIKFDHVEFIDNQPVLDLIELKPKGILVALDEEIKVPRGSDTTFLNKINKHHAASPHFKEVRTSKSEFVVIHYAGEVLYDSYSFLEKNKDTLTQDLFDLISSSRSSFLKSLFPDINMSGSDRKVSLGFQFRKQLDELMKTLNQTEPHYIRCVKPNDDKLAGVFRGLMCLQQLRYAGVFEAVKIRQQGYPFRYTHEDFVKRYGFMRPEVAASNKGNHKACCGALLKSLKGDFTAVQIGNTKTLYRAGEHRQFELLRNLAVEKQSIILQGYLRRWRAQKKAQKMFQLKPVLQRAIASRDLATIKDAIHQYKEIDWDIKEFIDAKNLRDVIELEIDITNRLNMLVNQDPEVAYDQMKKATEEAAGINFKSPLVNQCTDTVYNVTERRDCRAKLKVATEKAERHVLEEELARGKSLGMDNTDPTMKAADAEVTRIKKEEELVGRVQDEMTRGMATEWDHNTLNWQGLEAALNAATQFKCRTEVGVRSCVEAGLLIRIRNCLWNEQWPELGTVLKECVGVSPPFNNDEVKAAQDELSHKVATDDVLERLQQSIAAHDQNELAYALEQAQRLAMEQQEVHDGTALLQKIVQCREMMQAAIQAVDQKKLEEAVLYAQEFNYEREEVPNTQALLAEVCRLKKDLATGLHYMEKPIIEKAMEESEAIGLEWDQMDEGRNVLCLPEEKFLQRQLKTANQLHDPARAIRIMIQMKEMFFVSHGKLFTFQTYGNLRPPDVYSKAALLGRDKLRENMLKWVKQPIPTSLTFLPPLFAKQATKLFKNILGYMGDRSMSYPDQLAQDLLSQGLATPEVRDEVYCQIIKQLAQNPNPSSTQKGWKLMEFCLQTFAPGDDFANYLEMYLRSHHGKDREKNRFVLMLHDTQYGPRKTVAPSVETLERATEYTPLITLDVQTEIDPSKVKVADLDGMMAALPPGVGGPPGGGPPGGGFARPAGVGGGIPPPASAAASPAAAAPPARAAAAPPGIFFSFSFSPFHFIVLPPFSPSPSCSRSSRRSRSRSQHTTLPSSVRLRSPGLQTIDYPCGRYYSNF